MKISKCVCVLAIGLLLLTTIPVTNSENPTWLVMVYQAADNNLGIQSSVFGQVRPSAADIDVSEMRPIGQDVTVIVYQDLYAKPASIIKIDSGGEVVLPTSSLGLPSEPNMGNPNTLEDFVKAAQREYPADKTMLVLWNHGIGFLGSNFDDTSNEDRLGPGEIESALFGQHFDILGFDACLMGMTSVFTEYARNADYIIASPDYEPWDGWNYDFCAEVTGTTTPANMCREVIESYREFYQPISVPTTLTAIESENYLNDYLPQLVETTQFLKYEGQATISSAYSQTLKYEDSDNVAHAFIDTGHFLENIRALTQNVNFRNQIDLTLTEMDNSIVSMYSSYGPGTGTSVYLVPLQHDIKGEFYSYQFAERYAWGDFLKSFHSGGLTGSYQTIERPLIVYVDATTLRIESPEVGGRTEAKIDEGEWLWGEITVTPVEHQLFTRYRVGDSYSTVNGTTISGVTRIITDVSEEQYTITLEIGDNYLNFPSSPRITADEFLEITGGDTITKRGTNGIYTTYIREVKNVENNFDLEAGVGYIVFASSEGSYQYAMVPTVNFVTLLPGMNLIGYNDATMASDLAQEIDGEVIISGLVDGEWRIYGEEYGVTDFPIQPGALYIDSEISYVLRV